MRPNRLVPTIAISALLVAGAAFATVAAPAMHIGAFAAAAAKATPSPNSHTAKAQARCDSFVADLAKRLKTNPDNLKAQVKGAIDDQLAAAVKDGTLNQQQADAIKKKVDASKGCHDLPSFGSRHRGRGPGIHGLKDILGAAATALNVTPATLQADVMAGKTLQQIAPAGMTQDQFDTAFKAALSKVLDPQVAANKITAARETAEINEALKVAGMLWNHPLPHMGGFGGEHAPGHPAPGAAPPPIQ